jgi:hypothetical protein
MKITLDQETLAQAVTHHLKNIGVAADILKVEFRYTRVPYTIFAEVELSEARVHTATTKTPAPAPVEVAIIPQQPILDPSTLPDEDPEPIEQPAPTLPSSPLFGG